MIRRDQRAISSALTHALTISLTAILISTLLVGAGQLLDRQENTAARAQFADIGNDVVSQISEFDRLNRTGTNVTASVELNYPDRVVGKPYRLSITDDSDSYPFETDYALEIESELLERDLQYPVATETELDTSARVADGDVAICLRNAEITFGGACP
jgi:hypothetical protein